MIPRQLQGLIQSGLMGPGRVVKERSALNPGSWRSLGVRFSVPRACTYYCIGYLLAAELSRRMASGLNHCKPEECVKIMSLSYQRTGSKTSVFGSAFHPVQSWGESHLPITLSVCMRW